MNTSMHVALVLHLLRRILIRLIMMVEKRQSFSHLVMSKIFNRSI